MRVFRHRDFRFFWGTRVLGFLAIEMMITTVGWQVWRITGRELDLGLVGLAQFAPFAALFLISGLVADRVPRMRIIRACIAVQTVCAIGLIWLTLTGADNFTLILLLLILFGTSRAFQNPAQQAIVPNLVPKEDLPNAIAWSATGFQTARVVGPTISGILIAIGARFDQDETWVYGLVAIAFVMGIIYRSHNFLLHPTPSRVTAESQFRGQGHGTEGTGQSAPQRYLANRYHRHVPDR